MRNLKINGSNNHRKDYKKAQNQPVIEKRLEDWRSLTYNQQMQELDKRLGVGVGAKKQRARIRIEIEG